MRTRCIGQTDRERMISSRTRSFAPSPSSIYGSLEFRRLWDGARDLGDLALEDEAYERSIVNVDGEFYPGRHAVDLCVSVRCSPTNAGSGDDWDHENRTDRAAVRKLSA